MFVIDIVQLKVKVYAKNNPKGKLRNWQLFYHKVLSMF